MVEVRNRIRPAMAATPSKREQDMARRQGPGGGSNGGRWIAIGALAVVAVLVAVAAWPDDPVDSRAANVAAFGLDDDPFLGDPEAPVVLVGYESPHCSACQRFHLQMLPDLQAEYFDTGRVVYHYIQGTIGGDFNSNIAQECAHRHGGNDAFWRMTDLFYQRANTYGTPDLHGMLRQVADEQGLDPEPFVACLDGAQTSKAVSEDWGVGSDRGVRGTPTFWAFGPTGEALAIGNAGQIPAFLDQLVAEAG